MLLFITVVVYYFVVCLYIFLFCLCVSIHECAWVGGCGGGVFRGLWLNVEEV